MKRGARGIEEVTPGGRKRRPRGVNFRPPGGPKWLSGGLWRPPGASWAGGEAQEGGLGGKGSLLFFLKRPKKFFLNFQGPSWGPLGGFWADFGSFPPPRGGPGEAPGGHFWRFCETCSPRGEKERKILIFCCIFGAVFYAIFVLCCVPCCVLCGVAQIEKM